MSSSQIGWIVGIVLSCVAGVLPASAGEFGVQWRGTRRWAGPEVWASPLYDWRVEGGRLIATAGPDRLLQNTVWRVGKPGAEFYMGTALQLRGLESVRNKAKVWAGFAIAIKGLMDDPRHILVGPKSRLNAGVRGDGRLFIGDSVSDRTIDLSQTISLQLVYNEAGLRLAAFPMDNPKGLVAGPEPLATVAYNDQIPSLVGNIALAAIGAESDNSRADPFEVAFDAWGAEGEGVIKNNKNSFGPILWSQYTRRGSDIKLLVMLAPMGKDDPKAVSLEIKHGDTWKTIDTQDYEPLTYSALLRGKIPDGKVAYRVVYNYLDTTVPTLAS